MNKKEEFYTMKEYKCELKEGESISTMRKITPKHIENRLKEAINNPPADYNSLINNSKKQEKEIYDKAINLLDNWQTAAENTTIYSLAKQYKELNINNASRETTNNKWIEKDNYGGLKFEISNKTYEMYFRLNFDDHKTKEGRCEVSYWLSTNPIRISNYDSTRTIISVDKKKFPDKEKAMKYIEGRKKFYSKYFQELYNPILNVEDIRYFEFYGILLENYKISEQIVNKAE